MLKRVQEATIEDDTSVGEPARKSRYKEYRRCCDIFRDLDVVHVGDALRDGCEHGLIKSRAQRTCRRRLHARGRNLMVCSRRTRYSDCGAQLDQHISALLYVVI